MMPAKPFCAILLLTVLSQATVAEDEQHVMVCEVDGIVRLISVQYEETPVPCRVVYEKTDEDRILYPWTARYEAGYCEARVKSLIEVLEEAGFRCETLAEQKTRD